VRILIDSGSYHALNCGDIAMLQTAVERLRELWPHASIAVVTNAPSALASCCPGVAPVPLSGRVAWLTDRFLGRADDHLPHTMRSTLARVQQAMRHEWPMALGAVIALKRAVAQRGEYAAPLTYVNALRRADLVIGTGAGVFTDGFIDNALGVLTTIELAQARNIPTALTGHGLGPVTDPELKRRMAQVLPKIDLITLRERGESLRLLAEIGVPMDRVVVTGDDALEMSYRRLQRTLGSGIGVNVRVAGYAGTTLDVVSIVRPAIQRAAWRLAGPLVPLPVAHHPDCHDGHAIREVIADSDSTDTTVAQLVNPSAAIAEVSRCRVVVTGSYHAAVFALAQGIPVVALTASRYDVQKFAGLAELFPAGCTMVELDQRDATRALEAAVVDTWEGAPVVRPSLLRAAAHQIDRGRAAYHQLTSLVRGAVAIAHEQRAPGDDIFARTVTE
jgi:colanic acid/amylovoran biosynthesis protein